MLDHILLGCSDLDRGIDFVEEHTGVRAAFGGVHPGRGTRNALLSLGHNRYLEIIAPDPQQPASADHYGLASSKSRSSSAGPPIPATSNQFATRLRNANIAFDGPNPGSRKRPDGRLLQWKTLNLKDDLDGLLPFFIEWSADTSHPSSTRPEAATLLASNSSLRTPNKLSDHSSRHGARRGNR